MSEDPVDLLQLADRVVAQARPGEQVEAYVARGRETAVRVYKSEVEQFTSAQSEGIGIRVIRDGRTGFAYAGVLEESAIADVLAEARENVAYGTTDEYAGLAAPDGVGIVPVNLWSDELMAFPTDRKIALTLELERRCLVDARVRPDDANYSDAMGEAAVATTTGIRNYGRENGCYVSAGTLADDGEETHTGFGFSVGRHPDQLDLDRASGDAIERATRLIGAKKPLSRRTTVVFDPFVTAQFLGILSSTLNGESVAKGRSLFANRLGDLVANPLVTLVDDPTNPMAYTATDVDGEGLAARRNVLIDAGRLKQFVHSSYSARRASCLSTGNAVRGGFRGGTPGCGCLAMQLAPGARSQAEILAGIDEAVFVQAVMGMHSGVNAVSGDFSTGASGVMVRNGQLAEPVREFTIASTLQRMLTDVLEVGGDVEWLPMRAAGQTLVIADMTLSGS